MIVLGEKHGDVNVIHIIVGPETDFQLNLAGHVVMDITGDHKFDPDEKVIIVYNKCDSEEMLRHQLEMMRSQTRDVSQQTENSTGETNEKGSKGKPSRNSKKAIEEKKYGLKNDQLKCPKCKSLGARIKNGDLAPCSTCQDIDNGLDRNEIPPHPEPEKLKDINQDLQRDGHFKNFLKQCLNNSTKPEGDSDSG